MMGKEPKSESATKVSNIPLSAEQNSVCLDAKKKLEIEVGTKLTRGQTIAILSLRYVKSAS